MNYLTFNHDGSLAAYGQSSDALPLPAGAVACTPVQLAQAPLLALVGDVITVIAPPPPPVVGKPQQITATQFLNRIPPTALPVLYANPTTGVMLIALAAASMVALDDPAVQAGINALVPSVLTADQAAAILDH